MTKINQAHMDTQRAGIILEKINALYRSITADADAVSSIERDLMLSYLRQLYESVLGDHNSTPTPSQTTRTPQSSTTTKSAPVASTYEKPRIIKIPETIQEEIEKPVTTPNPAPRVVSQPEPPITEPAPAPAANPTSKSRKKSSKKGNSYDALFEYKEAKELSEKLSERPIADLGRAFSFNDKMLYANELFGGGLVTVNEVIGKLNALESYEAAKAMLEQYAEQYNWTKKDKATHAKDFIKVVRRRFIKK